MFLTKTVRNNGAGGSVLDKEWAYYRNNRNAIVGQYRDKYVVISKNNVIAAYDDRKQAYNETVKSLPLGSFMIHHVTEPEHVVRLSPFGYV